MSKTCSACRMEAKADGHGYAPQPCPQPIVIAIVYEGGDPVAIGTVCGDHEDSTWRVRKGLEINDLEGRSVVISAIGEVA